MKYINKFKRSFCMLLCVLIAALTLAPAASAIAYPQGVTAEQSSQAMKKTDVVLRTLVNSAEGKSLSDVVVPMLLSDSTLSVLIKTLYAMSEDNSQTFSTIGLSLSPADVSAYLGDYPDVQNRLAVCTSWSQVDLTGAVWGVTTTDDFVAAANAMLTPMHELLYAILCGGSYSLNALVGIQGANGYENAITKIFANMGMESITDPATFLSQAASDRSSMVRNMVYDVVKYIEKICSAPATMLSTKLPCIAYYINNGGLDNAVTELVEPLKIKVLGITTPIKIGSVMELAMQGEEGINIDVNIDMSGFSASGTLQTAPFDLDELASFAVDNIDGYIVNTSDSFIYILRWIIETVRLNLGSIPQMLSGMEIGMSAAQLSQILTGLFSKSTDELMSVFINLLTASKGSVNPYVWSFESITPAVVSYTENLGRDNFQRVLDGIDALIGEFIKEGGEAESIRAMLQPQIYSNKVVTELVVGIYSLLNGEQASQLISLTGLDLTPAALGESLAEDYYASVSETLTEISDFEQLKELNVNWGFKDGSKEGFMRTVSAVFRPMDSLLRMALCGDKITVLGAVSFYGSDGYNTAVIPLLEALGCTFEDISTYEQYLKEIKQTDVMYPVVRAVVSLIERMLDYPVYTLTGILPNFMYFINSGGIETCIKNLLYPVTSIVDGLGLSQQIDLSSMMKIDTDSIMDEALSKLNLGITLPEFDIASLGSIGTLAPVQTKRTQGGQEITIQYLQADRPAVMVTLLRYLVQIMKTPGNESLVDSFLGSNNDNEMFATYSADIGTEMADMSVDETIEWLYKLFFRERATVEENNSEDYTPTIIYTEKKNTGLIVALAVMLVILAAAVVIAVLKREKIAELLEKLKARKAAE